MIQSTKTLYTKKYSIPHKRKDFTLKIIIICIDQFFGQNRGNKFLKNENKKINQIHNRTLQKYKIIRDTFKLQIKNNKNNNFEVAIQRDFHIFYLNKKKIPVQ